ncbi:MAG: 16S rRNA (guanine(966)-N(2))-methyltransferase RsmD [Rhizobiales bacterium]|nr:16S rRNA (guanine(966)-N(2))-methyltransferase RsmD [Hyphomicrobiales bacterium]
MRIVGGSHKGKKLFTPKSTETRPTTDRVREAMFNKIAHGIAKHFDDFDIEGANVLDLFAGTGALGLEALSRGAKFAVFVEDAIEPRGLIRSNIEQLEFTGITKLFKRDATNLGPMKRFQPFNLIFLDPPYNKELGEKALNSAIEGGWLAEEALIILEENKSATITWPEGIELLDEKTYGDTTLYYAKWQTK